MRGSGSSSVLQRTAHEIEPTSADSFRRELEVRVRFDALQQGVGAHELDKRELFLPPSSACVLFVTGRLAAAETIDELVLALFELLVIHIAAEDVVVDVVPEVGHFAGRTRRTPAQRQVEPKRTLRLESRDCRSRTRSFRGARRRRTAPRGPAGAPRARHSPRSSARSSAAAGRNSTPPDSDPFVKSRSGSPAGAYSVRSTRPPNCSVTCGQVTSSYANAANPF